MFLGILTTKALFLESYLSNVPHNPSEEISMERPRAIIKINFREEEGASNDVGNKRKKFNGESFVDFKKVAFNHGFIKEPESY